MLISVGAISTISSAKRPSQHFLFSILPYLTKISFINKLNNIRDSGQLCLTPQLIGNSSDVIFR